MTAGSIRPMFRPTRVAVVGASERPGSVGDTLLRNLVGSGFSGAVYPVNPNHATVQGMRSYRRVGEVPDAPDLAVVCTPAAAVPGIVRQCGETGIRGVLIISAGFREAGAAGRALEQEVLEAAAPFDRMRIIGPNCLGIVVPDIGLNATFARGMPRSGKLAFISQSGALGTAVLDWALTAEVGFSGFVSIGNAIDVSFGDLIDHFGSDGRTEAIVLYVESITGAREFISAARAFTRDKPIVAYKAGRFAESAAAAASHTGAMAGEDAVYDAAFERAGIVRVYGMAEMFECAEALARHTPPEGGRLAIVSNAGGPAVMATDALIGSRGTLATLSADTLEDLNRVLPACWSHGNPVDVLGDAPAERIAHALQTVLADEAVDGVLVMLAPQAVTDPTATAAAVAAVAKRSKKLVLAAWMGGASMAAGIAVLDRSGIATYATPEGAVQAFTALVRYTRNREILHETPREVVSAMGSSRWRKERLSSLFGLTGATTLTEHETKEVLAGYGIDVNETVVATSQDQAAAEAMRLGYPAVIKVHSRAITHKTDVGGVALDLYGDEAVRTAYARVVGAASEHRPGARIDGVTVQRMISAPEGVELILGARKDPTFGSAIMIGMGGVAAELYRDRAIGLPPLNERLARRMLESLRAWPLLTGYRGRPGLDVETLVAHVIRFSCLIADHPEIAEVDVNPLLVHREGAIALDGRIMLDPEVAGRGTRPYQHLAIRPYPEQCVRRTTLADGSGITLRPIRAEDEPRWRDMLSRCSAESQWSRFRAIFKKTTHAMASRYCYIDYDREMAIVAEHGADGARRLIGVGRLVADPEGAAAEYAVLVADAWQGKGIGLVLTEFCLQIARDWGVERVVAETTRGNRRMLAIFESLGFDIAYDDERECVVAAKAMPGRASASPSMIAHRTGPARS